LRLEESKSPRTYLYITIACLWAWIAASLVVLFIVRPRTSWPYFIPLAMGPFLGIVWVWNWAADLVSARAHNLGFSMLFGFLVTPIGYVFLSLLYAFSYRAAIPLGGQVVSADGECVRSIATLIYFGVVTGATVGYGDLVPQGLARLLACFQIIEFWLFLGVAALYLQRAGRRTGGATDSPAF